MSPTPEVALTPSMTTSLTRDLIEVEGDRRRPYRDTAGHLTILVGHNLDAEGLCDAARDAQLAHDITTKALPIYEHLTWLQEAPEGIQLAVLNMTFNLGIAGMLKFDGFLSLLQEGSYVAAADHLMSLPYAKQVPNRASRLAKQIRDVV